MLNFVLTFKRSVLICFLFVITGLRLSALDLNDSGGIVPGPDPFSLDAESAVYCIGLLKHSRYLEQNQTSGDYKIVVVDTVWSRFLGYDESYPEGHRLRYDIVVNGNLLAWDNGFIEYGGEMVNLRLLFIYRNQYPPVSLEYRAAQ